MLPYNNDDEEKDIITLPILTIKAIKNILLREYNDFKSQLYSISEFHIKKDYWSNAIDSIETEIGKCTTYEDLESFVGEHYKMSLQEWANSL